ncbi:MAG: S-methyl-5-thioribose-1-phosphate isomerase [Chthonomonadales bacterium]
MTVAWTGRSVRLVDQTLLPERLEYREYEQWRDVADAIRSMVVRGAPAIGCTAALGLALAGRNAQASSRAAFEAEMEAAAAVFRSARPTAVNLFWAVDRIMDVVRRSPGNVDDVRGAMLAEALQMLHEDVSTNRALGRHGASLLRDGDTVLTHCNAGALACVGYGTALGVIRAAREAGKHIKVLADETRPRLQGMKLTAWELHREGIPVTVIADNMAASLMRAGQVSCVIVGADRIAANGDTANKIGTYGLAVLSRHHSIPFYVAAPISTVDFTLDTGARIPIEQRPAEEVTHINGVRIAPEGVGVLNPAFDVTPHELITAIITEEGVAYPPFASTLAEALARQQTRRRKEQTRERTSS